MRILSGQFSIAKWEEQTLIKRLAPQKLNEAEIAYDLQGDMVGTLSGKYLMAHENDKTATYIGILVFEGKIGAHSGQFALHEDGKFENDVANTKWTIISGSGTDDFAKITGKGGYAATSRTVDYTLEIEGIGQS
jgi:hypothetical protein